MITMFDRASVVIKDPEKLSFDYVPEKLIGREEQMNKLSMIFRPVIESGRSESAFLTGSVGTGKTSTAKRFIDDMMRYASANNVPMDYVVVNCRQASTESTVLHKCLTKFDPKYPDRGFSSQEMLRALKAHIEKRKLRFVIILDEINVLLKRGSGDLIYQLSRISEDSLSTPLSVSMILISQEYVLDRLDDASLSTFKRVNTIRFPKYDYNNLRKIVESRAEMALVDGSYDGDVISLIADRATGDGDARFAIDLLDKAARLAETRKDGLITADDVRSVSDMVFSVVNQPKLEELGKNELLVLLAVARSIKSQASVQLSVAEKTYAVVCEEYEVEARKHTQFYEYIKNLIKMNLLVEPPQDSAKYKTVSIPDIPSKELAKRIEAVLEKVL